MRPAKPELPLQSPTAKSAHSGPIHALHSVYDLLRLAHLLYEKCEIQASSEVFVEALELARTQKDLRATVEALIGLLRVASDSLDSVATRTWIAELNQLIEKHGDQVPPMAWYCKGGIARDLEQLGLAQRHFHRCLRALRLEPEVPEEQRLVTREESFARTWSMIAVIQLQRGKVERASHLAEVLLARYNQSKPRGVLGVLFLLQGKIAERAWDLPQATVSYQKAHGAFLAEHNWYYHLFVLYGYARVARMKGEYSQAYWYLDLLERTCAGPGFDLLRKEIMSERKRLEQDAVDLLIDSRKGLVRTREGGAISLGKQYVLLNILEALSSAHSNGGEPGSVGLSKAEIIEKVWRETYRPEAHDNKLYYNINRLRRLIEPDVRKPQYLLNWREGYRLAPGLRIQWVGAKDSQYSDLNGGKSK